MRRRVFNVLWVVSLMMFVATIVLWVRSHRALQSLDDADSIYIKRSEPIWWIISNPGRATLCRQVGKDWAAPMEVFRLLGIEFTGVRGRGSILWNLSVPYWMIATVLAVLPIVRLEQWRRSRRDARRRRVGRCETCGYDLRATPQRCPECGTVSAIE